MNINVIAVGKIKEKYIKEGIAEFSKRLSRYASLKIIEINDEKAPENLSDKEMEMIKDKEAAKIIEKIPQNSHVIVLTIDGKQLSSEALSEKMGDIMLGGESDITFIIGGSLGLSNSVVKKSNYQLSFSKMTFPHQLMRLILLEQVYRAFKILKGETYHK